MRRKGRPMTRAISIAASGLAAAGLRFEASASNIANERTTGRLPSSPTTPQAGQASPAVYQPLAVRQTASASGGVSAQLMASQTPPSAQYDPASPFADERGLVGAPAIDLAHQFVEQMLARRAFEANLKSLKAAEAMEQTLIDQMS